MVVINAGASVGAIKGPERASFNEEERLEVLSELQSIDYLVVFEEPTADRLIESVSRHKYVRGGE